MIKTQMEKREREDWNLQVTYYEKLYLTYVFLLVFVTVAYQWTPSTREERTFLQSEDILVPQLQRIL